MAYRDDRRALASLLLHRAVERWLSLLLLLLLLLLGRASVVT